MSTPSNTSSKHVDAAGHNYNIQTDQWKVLSRQSRVSDMTCKLAEIIIIIIQAFVRRRMSASELNLSRRLL